MRQSVALETVLETLVALEACIRANDDRLVELWGCSHCKAQAGEPCRRPDGAPLQRGLRGGDCCRPHHAPRIDRMLRARNECAPGALRDNLLRWGDSPALVLRKIRGAKMYQRLVAQGLLNDER